MRSSGICRCHVGLPQTPPFLPGAPRGDGGVVACCHVIGQWQQGFEESIISLHGGWKRQQRGVCEARANRFGLAPFVSIAPETSLHTRTIESLATEFTGAITEVIGSNHQVSSFDRPYVWPNSFNHAHPFMKETLMRAEDTPSRSLLRSKIIAPGAH